MPVYEFRCETCGPFELSRALEDAAEAAGCPVCGAAATRVFSVPLLARMPRAAVSAHERNERSVHEPEVVKRPKPEEPPTRPKPSQGHGRPWQLGH